jgi:D-lactate dehydrogenase
MNQLEQELCAILPPERVKCRLIDRYAFAGDASHFYLIPKAVVQPQTVEEVKQLFALSHRLQIPVTFRAAGTSLSGQSVTDGILVDLSNYWRKIVPEQEGALVRVEPAAIGAHVNQALKKFGRKIGPDPASIQAAMMGGILSNNASGMCCGVAQNSYHTLRSMTFVLPNGMLFNSEKEADHIRFETEAAEIADALRSMREEIRQNADLVSRIRKKYQQKNTVGYCMNAFLDFERPLDILTHVIVGGEGTLAFVAEAVLQTVPDLPCKMTGMLYFESPQQACGVIPQLIETGAAALEFMDRASLRSVEDMPGVPALLKDLRGEATAILCEFQQADPQLLKLQFEKARTIFSTLPLLHAPDFTLEPSEQAILWKIRKGMYPSVAGLRAKGTSALLEDFTFPVERLGDAVVDVQSLFKKYKYDNGIIFGHAKDGNLHFVISQGFSDQKEVDHYRQFNDELFDLVLNKYDGALKAEHSTGRAVSAFVEKEWGPDAYRIMKKLKTVIDPDRLLNPGIIITENPLSHIHDLKVMPVVEEEVDKCIECGFCEQSCPSRDLTLTPRRRIAVRRAMRRLQERGDETTRRSLLKDYQYEGLETCAVDGLCAVNCPVDINTGELVKRLRRENHSGFQQWMARQVARNFAFFESLVRLTMHFSLGMNQLLGKNFMRRFTQLIKRVLPGFPLWSNQIRKPGSRLQSQRSSTASSEVIYFTTCISRMMGGETGDLFLQLCRRADIGVIVPDSISGTCCGQIFSSKGFTEAFRETANATIQKLWQLSDQGRIPVVLDVTSCTQTVRSYRPYLSETNRQFFDSMKLIDLIDFAADLLLPRLAIGKPKQRIVFHPVCSVTKMGSLPKLQQIGKACAVQADFPVFAGCCGMAGDRGFYYPQLTAAATRTEINEVNQIAYDGYYSSSRTCEMALSESSGKEYNSILKLLEEVSRD